MPVSRLYNSRDRSATSTDRERVVLTSTFDPVGRLRTQPDGGVGILGYTSRLRTSLALQQPVIGDWTESFVNDSARRLQSLTSPAGTFTYGYVSAAGSTASRLVQSIAVPTTAPSSQIFNSYDTTGHLLSTALKTGATIHNSHSYLVNVAHERTKQTRPDGSYVDYRSLQYTYDDENQLIAVETDSSATPVANRFKTEWIYYNRFRNGCEN